MDLFNSYKKVIFQVVELVFRSTGGKMKSLFHTVRKVRCNQLFLSTFIITMFTAIIGTETLSKYGNATCTKLNLNYQLDPNLVRHAAEGSPPDCRNPPLQPRNQNVKKKYTQVYQTFYTIHPSAESPTETC
jgi:hypothetical protein